MSKASNQGCCVKFFPFQPAILGSKQGMQWKQREFNYLPEYKVSAQQD